MTTNTISAAANPTMVNKLVDQVMAETEAPVEKAKIVPPSDTTVNLPGGYVTFAGEVVRTAEVRELNGRDEEAIAKASNAGKMFNTILSRAVVTVGDERADETLLNNLLAGDRDALLLGIFKATFGADVEIPSLCTGCNEWKQVEVNVDRDVKSKVLVDPIGDRKFTVQGKKNEYLVTLPNGVTQKELSTNSELTTAEFATVLLENTVLEINGQPVYSKAMIQNLGIVDRRKISEEIYKRNPGPQFEDTTVTCPDCEGEVAVPINFGTLFRF